MGIHRDDGKVEVKKRPVSCDSTMLKLSVIDFVCWLNVFIIVPSIEKMYALGS